MWLQIAAAAGLLALAYLTKGTGLLLMIGMLLWLAVGMWRRSGKYSSAKGTTNYMRRFAPTGAALLLAVLCWGLVASPLLVRNARRFGNPLFNINSYYLFADEFSLPKELDISRTPAEAALEYIASHAPREMAMRELRGLAWESFIMVRGLGPAPLDDSRVLFGAMLAALAASGAITRPRGEAALLGIWLALFLMTFAWYTPIAAGERFIAPLIPLVLMYSAIGAARLAALVSRRLDWQWSAAAIVSLAAIWCIAWCAISVFSGALPGRLA